MGPDGELTAGHFSLGFWFLGVVVRHRITADFAFSLCRKHGLHQSASAASSGSQRLAAVELCLLVTNRCTRESFRRRRFGDPTLR
jgi:hypothetical protein